MTYLERLKTTEAILIFWVPEAGFLVGFISLFTSLRGIFSFAMFCLGLFLLCGGVFIRARKANHALAPVYGVLLAFSGVLLVVAMGGFVAYWTT